MPIRSSGCATCRDRRIRCDETRPACQRCLTHGVQCPGFRTQQQGGVEIIDVTASTARRAAVQYRKKGQASGALQERNKRHSLDPSPGWAFPTISSQQSSTAITTSKQATAQPWRDAILSVSIATGLNASIPSPSVMSSQIYSTFLDVYLPKETKLSHSPVFHEMATRPVEDQTLIQARNALSLVAVGGGSNDTLVRHEAVLEYGRALRYLARALSRPNFQPTDEILAATTLLSLCEFYEDISAIDGWQKHLHGAATMLMSRGGPESIKTRFGLMLFSNSRHGALAANLISRKGGLLGQKTWRKVLFKAPTVELDTYFYDHALQVPALLEKVDALDTTSPNIISDIDKLLEDFIEREQYLRSWFAIWAGADQLTADSGFERRRLEEFATFANLVSDRTFDEAFWFPDWPFGYLASQYWSTLYYLLLDKLELQQLKHELDSVWQPLEEDIEAELRQLADNLCMCMPYFCEPVSSLSGQIGIFLPMRVCAEYFVRVQDWPKARWIQNMRQNVFTRGLIPPR